MCVNKKVFIVNLRCCPSFSGSKAKIFNVFSTKPGVLEEVALVAFYIDENGREHFGTKCCKRPLVEIRRLICETNNSYKSKDNKPVVNISIKNGLRLYDEKALSYINLLSALVIWEQKVVNPVYQVENRWWLGYNEWGHPKKCYQNLSNLPLGKLPDLYEDISDFDKKIILNKKG